MNLTVIKLGGSLMGSAELSHWLETIETVSINSNIVIVPGGGKFSDSVRSLQKIHQFDDYVAHQMALLSMSQYGYLLAEMNKKLKIIEDIAFFSSYPGKNPPLLWLPTALINDDSEIPASWDYASDSIALWLATKLSASRLVIVKSKNLNKAKTTICNHINNGNLDYGFQHLEKYYSGKISFYEKQQYKQLHELSIIVNNNIITKCN